MLHFYNSTTIFLRPASFPFSLFSIVHTKPHTFSSFLQFYHNLSAPFYSNILPTPHYTLFHYVLLSNHPVINHYCTYCLHRYYYFSPGALTHKQQAPKNCYCLYDSVSPHEKSIRSVYFPPFHSTTLLSYVNILIIGCNLL